MSTMPTTTTLPASLATLRRLEATRDRDRESEIATALKLLKDGGDPTDVHDILESVGASVDDLQRFAERVDSRTAALDDAFELPSLEAARSETHVHARAKIRELEESIAKLQAQVGRERRRISGASSAVVNAQTRLGALLADPACRTAYESWRAALAAGRDKTTVDELRAAVVAAASDPKI